MATATWHAGERRVQALAGSADRVTAVGPALRRPVPAAGAAFLRTLPFVVIATADAHGALWAGITTGPPGFVAADGGTVTVHRLPDRTDPTRAAVRPGAAVGLLGLDYATRGRVRVNGRITAASDGFVVAVDEAFSNCPAFIPDRTDPATPPAGPVAVAAAERLDAAARRLIERSDSFFVATGTPTLGFDASHRGGDPGFVTLHGAATLSWPDLDGNGFFQTLGNLDVDDRAGLLFADPSTATLLHVTGRARLEVTGAGARRVAFTVARVVTRRGVLGPTATRTAVAR